MPDNDLVLNLIEDFELRHGDRVIDMAPSSQRLVSLVALHERPIRRAQASGLLWRDVCEERASASLRSALWRVPQPDGAPVLRASTTHLWLDARVRVDFRATIARAQQVLHPHQGVSVIDIARELGAFGADLLLAWCDEWVIMERERFHQLRLDVLDELGTCLADDARYAEALQLGLVAVEAEPLRETAHRLITRIHLEQGNVAQAIRQYRYYEQLLARELGARPSGAMRALLEQCVDTRVSA